MEREELAEVVVVDPRSHLWTFPITGIQMWDCVCRVKVESSSSVPAKRWLPGCDSIDKMVM